MNTKLIVIPVIIAIASILGVLIYSSGEYEDTTTESDDITIEQTGVVDGVVYYVGTLCADNKRTPPCDGPYPDYEVVIFENIGKTIAARIFTDDEGKFEEQLPSGDYLVFGKIKAFGKLEETPIQFTVESQKMIHLEILIDEGLR